MKKIILALLSVVILGNASIAQDKAKTATKNRVDATQPQQSTAKRELTPHTPKPKKDGTPDMRRKANKDAKKVGAVSSLPPQKGNTPDMRHKANKDAATGGEKK